MMTKKFSPGTLVRFLHDDFYYAKNDLGLIIGVHLVTGKFTILKFMILHVNCSVPQLRITSAPDWLCKVVT